jgi:hypothetical protein
MACEAPFDSSPVEVSLISRGGAKPALGEQAGDRRVGSRSETGREVLRLAAMLGEQATSAQCPSKTSASRYDASVPMASASRARAAEGGDGGRQVPLMSLILTAQYDSPSDFLKAFDSEVSQRGLLVRGADALGIPAMSECTLLVRVAGTDGVEVRARVAAVVPGVGVAVMLDGVPPLRAARLPTPPEEEPKEGAPKLLSERLKAMNVTQKMQLALSGGREERMALFRDVNKTLHVYVLRNPRIALDEIQYAAKQPSLSPEALKMIAEHREWGSNATVCAALVRNPKTPLPVALRLLERIPASDLRAIAKGGARDQIVHAARKKLGSPA